MSFRIFLRAAFASFISLYRSREGKSFIFPRPFRGLRISLLQFITAISRSGRVHRLFTFRSVVFSSPLSVFTSLFSPLNGAVTERVSRVPLSISRRVISGRHFSQFLQNRNGPFFSDWRVGGKKFTGVTAPSGDMFQRIAYKAFFCIYIASGGFYAFSFR